MKTEHDSHLTPHRIPDRKPPHPIVESCTLGCGMVTISEKLTHPRQRVLIVSPHFPPVNAPDHQRIRGMLPYLRSLGWDAHILCVQPDEVPHPHDPLLKELLPDDLPITRTTALPARLTSRIGLGNVGWRCLPYFRQEGDRILQEQAFDLIFFSTTIFPVMLLGPYWKRRFNIPYVLDFQDPWRSDYRHSSDSIPPGGRLKYGITQFLARMCEPIALKSADHIISVSPAYPKTLQRRYSWLRDDQFTVLPFGAPEQDIAQLPQLGIRQSIFNPTDGKRHWVYVGRGGSDMVIALHALFRALRTECDRHPDLIHSLHLHFIGTSYAPLPLAVKTIEPIAQQYNLAELVTEHPYRIPYFEAQQVLADSDVILMIGSDDPGYTASKLYPGILARKPILGIFHAQSSAITILNNCNVGAVVPFQEKQSIDAIATHVSTYLKTSLSLPKHYQPDTNWSAFEPYTARCMTQKLCDRFDRLTRVQR